MSEPHTGISIRYEFDLGDRVRVLPIGVDGEIVGLYVGQAERQMYEVRYWYNAEKKTEYFYVEELKQVAAPQP